jgi:SAM-dependent methyltransferase
VPGGPGTRWGWHQLSDPWAERLVRSAGIRRGDLVVDIGAGAGAITRPLVERGARVVAVELHPGRAADLQRRFADDAVTVVRADAAELRLPRRPFSVVANPPFAAASAVLRRLLSPGSRLTHARLVLPAPPAAVSPGTSWVRYRRTTAANEPTTEPPPTTTAGPAWGGEAQRDTICCSAAIISARLVAPSF